MVTVVFALDAPPQTSWFALFTVQRMPLRLSRVSMAFLHPDQTTAPEIHVPLTMEWAWQFSKNLLDYMH
ncbi:MAG: hypothetical protein F4X92_04075 [Gammaproteobacteria bacterium]|nr:hypothetical protein [Gammaproteobacteria bacterium]